MTLVAGVVDVKPSNPRVNLLLFLLTLLSVFFAGAIYSYDGPMPEDPAQQIFTLIKNIHTCIPFGISMLAILLAHEFGHYLDCSLGRYFSNTLKTLKRKQSFESSNLIFCILGISGHPCRSVNPLFVMTIVFKFSIFRGKSDRKVLGSNESLTFNNSSCDKKGDSATHNFASLGNLTNLSLSRTSCCTKYNDRSLLFILL